MLTAIGIASVAALSIKAGIIQPECREFYNPVYIALDPLHNLITDRNTHTHTHTHGSLLLTAYDVTKATLQ